MKKLFLINFFLVFTTWESQARFISANRFEANSQLDTISPDTSYFESELILQSGTSFNQEVEKRNAKPSVSYFLDDFSVFGGINSSGLSFSNNRKNLAYTGGFQFGVQEMVPLGKVTFFNYGIQYSKRGFSHESEGVSFSNYYLEFPFSVSFELPELRNLDFRFYLGAQIASLLSTKQTGQYGTDPDFFYDPGEFTKMDAGFIFGLSIEKSNFFLRVGSYIGLRKLAEQDTGFQNSFSLDFGYYLFRSLRK
jgi:hypothetical protein